MGKQIGKITIALDTQTDQFVRDMREAKNRLAEFGDSVTHALEGVAALGAGLASFSSAATTATASTGNLVNTYRALRIAFDPSLFTASTIALGVLVEETVRLTDARGKLIEQQSLLAASSGRSFASVAGIDAAASITGGNAATLQTLAGLTSEDLADVARRFEAIKDPVARAAEAVRIFGTHAGEALRELTPEFIAATEANEKFGASLNEVSRTQIAQFHDDLVALKNAFTTWPELDAFTEKVKTRLAEMGAAAEDAGKRGFKALDDWIARNTGLRGALVAPLSLSGAELAPQRPDAASQIVRQDLLAQENAARQRAAETLEGHRKQRDAVQKQLDDFAKLSGAEQLVAATQIQAARQRLTSIEATIKAQEAAEAAAKKAAAKAEELANWQAKAPERLQQLWDTAIQRTITTPVAAEMFRGRGEVLRDSDRTTAAEKAARADIATQSLQAVVNNELRKLGQAWEKEVTAEESRRQKLYEFELSHSIAKDEATVNAMRQMADVLESRDIAAARIGAQPDEVVATARKVLDIQLQQNDSMRNQYLTEAQIMQLDAQRQRALSDYDLAVKGHTADLQRDALATGGTYQLQLRLLEEQMKALGQIEVTSKNISDINLARKELEDKILETQKQQALASGSLMDGWNAFLYEMEKRAEEPGVILFHGMNSAIDRISDSLGKVMTGQSGGFGQAFKDIGNQISTQTVRSSLQTGLGQLAKHFGLGVKRDGQSAQTAPYVIPVDANGNSLFGAPGSTAGPGTIFGGSAGGGIFNFGSAGLVGYLGQVLKTAASVNPASAPIAVTQNISITGGSDQDATRQDIVQAITQSTKAAIIGSLQAQADRVSREVVTSTVTYPQF
jgi:hypothetical protein